MIFDAALPVADAIFHEGYLLYPYRASATKNRYRWQFGVLAPRRFSEATGIESCSAQTECLLEPLQASEVHVRLRCLQVETRRLERLTDEEEFEFIDRLTVDGREHFAWEEGVEHELDLTFRLTDLLTGEKAASLELAAARTFETIENSDGALLGRYVRERMPVKAGLTMRAEAIESPSPLLKLRLGVENLTPWQDGVRREEALPWSMIAVHALFAAPGGEFLSLTDPPEWARSQAAECQNRNMWPVLAGEPDRRDLIISAPIILADYPRIAPESAGEFFDSTEIDELLALRTATLTPEEKQEAGLTDPRAASIIERADGLPPEIMDRLHGAVRYMRQIASGADESDPQPAHEQDTKHGEAIFVQGIALQAGDMVQISASLKANDAQDLFYTGRLATIEKILRDAEDRTYAAVILADDPGAEMHRWHGRYLYFTPDELELPKVRRP